MYILVWCQRCGGTFEIYSRDDVRSNKARTCPHCQERATGETWAKVADAFDWEYARIASESDAARLIPEILKKSCPVFCDVRLTPGYSFAPKLSSRKLPDGTLVSPSLEDMYPFLPREEMLDNVYLK